MHNKRALPCTLKLIELADKADLNKEAPLPSATTVSVPRDLYMFLSFTNGKLLTSPIVFFKLSISVSFSQAVVH